MPDDAPTVVVLRGDLSRPDGWGDSTRRHVLVDEVEEVDDGEAYRLVRSDAPKPWVLSQQQIEAVRPPGHPGYPENLDDPGNHQSAAEVLARLTGDSVEEFEFDGEIPDLADLDEEWIEEHYRELLEE